MNHASDPGALASPPTRPKARRGTALWKYLAIALASLGLLIGAAIPAAAAELMRVTFVRHAESEGNASGLIDTKTPGPVLTAKGYQQAQDVVDTLGDNNYDAIYASTMVRTQLTAAPMSQYLRLPIQVLPGLQEIEAGNFEGTPESGAESGYGLYPIGWTFPGVIPQIPVEYFNKGTKMPGTELDGYAFDARVDGALQTMYDNGDRNAVVFSHGGTIMFWTMMNVNNLTTAQKLQLLQTARLDNTDYVVIEGNNEDGWTLVNWNGQEFAPEPTLENEVKLQLRTLTRQLDTTHQQVVAAFGTGDFKTIATAVNRGITDAGYSLAKFRRAVNAKIINEVDKAISPDSPAPSSTGVSTLKAGVETLAQSATAAVSTPLKDLKPLKAVKDRKALKAVQSKSGDAANAAKDTATADKPETRTERPGQRLQDALKDVRDRVAQKLGNTGKKGAGAAAGDSGSQDAA